MSQCPSSFEKKKSNLVLIIQFAVDCLDCPRTVRAIRLDVGSDDFGIVFFLENVERAVVVAVMIFLSAS